MDQVGVWGGCTFRDIYNVFRCTASHKVHTHHFSVHNLKPAQDTGETVRSCVHSALCVQRLETEEGGEYKYRDICTLSPHTLITLISMLSIHTHLVFILFIFDSTMEGTLEHEPTHMVCVVEPGSGVEECVEVKESCKTIQSTTGYLYPRTWRSALQRSFPQT